jgi:hypothetical protein
MRATLRSDIVDPKTTQSNTDNEALNRAVPMTANDDPKRVKPLIDKVEPRWKKSRTAKEAPIRA